MNSDQLFSLANMVVLPGWLLLITAPRWLWTEKIVTGIIVSLLALTYTFLIATHFNPSELKNFGSLKGVTHLFTDENTVLAGWIHYLAFDLMIGLFEVKNAQKHSIPHLLVIPCLFLTFMLGPIGLLIYFIIRIVKTRQYFSSTF